MTQKPFAKSKLLMSLLGCFFLIASVNSVQAQNVTDAVIKVTYEKVPVSQTMTNLGLVWSNVTEPNIFSFTGGNIITKDVQSLNLTSGDQEFTITGLKGNTKYYVRANAATNAPGNYYNYSTQIEVQE